MRADELQPRRGRDARAVRERRTAPTGYRSPMALTVLVLSCTLKKSPAAPSATLIDHEVLDALGEHGVSGEVVRVVDHDVHFGVSTDEGDGDEWRRSGRRCSPRTSW
ncbi:hypothetical protein [Nocardioides faecalis]|uniref:hypothetical protein n=1 Tax=Nocardioides faecalis TaxID=2803858 RepID=UPI002017FA33|nr:hypothetical protein [Nocardioides faecalis]